MKPQLSFGRYLLALTFLSFSLFSSAQNVIRCYTDEMDEIRRQNDPSIETRESFEDWMTERVQFNQNALIVGGVYQIPVVVHVIHNGEAVGSGTNVSMAAIQSQIDVLNEDFRKIFGSNGYNTHPSGADTEIEFCLAQRRPDGSAFPAGENGVNRINRNTAGFTAPPYTMTYIDNTIKPWTYNNNVPTATRGWDPSKYMNIWLCDISGGILGYAQFPESPLGGMGCGTQSAATDGVVFLYNSIGKSSVTGFPGPYNEGRTATHEVGHWLGLRHIWGDGGCTVDDFCNDTPVAGAANYGCPTGTNSCTTTPDAPDMIENYMDYTDDLCMNIFTYDQKMRMRIVLEASPRRALLITSDACVPPNPSDAAVVNIINPAGDNCAGSITPSVVLRNRGSNNLTSATINYSVDNGATTTFSWTGSLTPGSSATVNLPAFTAVLGQHTFKSWNTLPNGIADPSPSLDTSSVVFMVSNGIEAPYIENFDGGVFPPDIRWVVNNPNADCYEWLGAAATSITGEVDNVAAQMPGFGNNTGGTENLITPIFLLPCNATAANIQFDVAYRRRNNTTANYERLYIEISENCGATWNATPIYDKTGTVLQTVTSTQTTYFTPTASTQWRTETVDLLPFVTGTSKNIKFRIRAVAANGNNIYIDNFRFNATTPGEVDVTLTSINVLDGGYADMGSVSAGSPLTATFTVTNSGTTNLNLNNPITVTGTNFSLGTGFGSTTLAAGASTTFTITFNSPSGGSFTGGVSFGTNDCDEGTYNFELYATATTTPPVADFTGTPTTVCAGSTVTFTNLSTNALTYSWNFGAGATPSTSTAANPTVTFSTPGAYTISLTATNSFGADTETKNNYILVVDATGAALPLSEGFTAATFVPTGWTLVNNNSSPTTWARSATIGVAPTAGNSMVFDNFAYNDGDDDEVQLIGLNFSGYSSATLTFDVAYARYNATYSDGLQVLVSSDCGVTFSSVYNKSGTTLATAPDVTTSFTPTAAQWRNETVDLTAYVGNPKVIVAFRNLSGYGNRLFVDNINLSGVASTAPPVASFTATPTTLCSGQTVAFTSTSTGSPTTYSWSFPGGTPATSTSPNPTITYNTAGVYDVTLTVTNGAGSDSDTQTGFITVNAAPAVPGSITGSASVCSGATGLTYSVTAVPGATTYNWTVPSGASITAGAGTNSITVTMGSTSGNISVTAQNSCGTSAASSLAVTVSSAPTTPGAISGPLSACSGATGLSYSIPVVSGATTYNWTLPAGASITSGSGTNSIVVTMGSSSGNISVTAQNTCGTSTPSTVAVTIGTAPATPGAITGTTTVCTGTTGVTYNVPAVAGATSYNWVVPAGSTITAGSGTNSITVTIGSTSGNVSVTAQNSCGVSTASTLAISVNSTPATPGSITGSSTVCPGSTGNVYSVASVQGATSYTWTVPSGATITAGQGTNASTVTFGSNPGNVTVIATNTCGSSSAATLPVTLSSSAPATPGTISGPISVCEGQSAVSYSVALVSGATSYAWSVPSGATVASGQGTNTISVNFGTIGGSISVSASSSCGTSGNSTQAITVNSIPTAPSVAVVDNCGSSTLTASGTGSFIWSTTETNASITVSSSGSYTVTQTVNGCTSTPASISASPIAIPAPPSFSVNNTCGSSTLSAVGSNLLWSTGETTSSITVSSAGDYTVTQTVNGCSSSPATVTAAPEAVLPTPSVTVTNDCGSTTLTTDATEAVLWSTGETTSTITVLNPGTYTVTQSNGSCTSSPASTIAAPLSVPEPPTVTVDDKCGSSDLIATGSNLQWSTSETGSMITVTSPGTYFVSQTVNGCTSPVATVVASPLSVPSVTFSPLSDVCIDDPAFVLSGGSPAGGNYTGTGVNSNTFDPSTAGFGTFLIYYEYTDANGCSAIAHQPITVGCADLNQASADIINVYPNPTNGIVNIVHSSNEEIYVKVIDQTGRLIEEVSNTGGELLIDLSRRAEGIYSLIITFNDRVIHQKVVLNK